MAVWSYQVKKISATEYDLVFVADMENGWYIYSQFIGDEGPIPTSFQYDLNNNVQLVGKSKEAGYKKEGFDEIFGMNLIKFGKEVTFTQRIKVSTNVKEVVGNLTYMTCNDEQCLPPTEVPFSFILK
ncbi:MAG: hypothetical protein HC892_13735 [Saprospiraceae bacterium]|nr:hypothetical protein [Saprospiraceae bacterium]